MPVATIIDEILVVPCHGRLGELPTVLCFSLIRCDNLRTFLKMPTSSVFGSIDGHV